MLPLITGSLVRRLYPMDNLSQPPVKPRPLIWKADLMSSSTAAISSAFGLMVRMLGISNCHGTTEKIGVSIDPWNSAVQPTPISKLKVGLTRSNPRTTPTASNFQISKETCPKS
ncbi:hypothetical protein ABW19_dt0207724 [Dactylella cylindrospora]|nr:hypothetical protein ABW19_dt0207724 [Dactylella cylindrospora]